MTDTKQQAVDTRRRWWMFAVVAFVLGWTCPPPFDAWETTIEASTGLRLASSGELSEDGSSEDLSVHKPPSNTYNAWCPKADCEGTEICEPCKRRFLIIISTGRAASTSLTWTLDALPGLRMSGENLNLLGRVRDMLKPIEMDKNYKRGDGKKNHAWGRNHVPTWACAAQSIIEASNPPMLEEDGYSAYDAPEDIVGFKTIRFLDGLEKFQDKYMVEFVKEKFPCSRIIVNYRSDVDKQAESQSSAAGFDEEIDVAELKKTNKRLLEVAEMFGEQAWVLDKDQWTTNVTKINEVVGWLGFNKACYFKELLELNTQENYGHGRTEVNLKGGCKPI